MKLKNGLEKHDPQELIDNYFALQDKIFEYFGYKEGWTVIPLNDCRQYFWFLTGEGPEDRVIFTEKNLFNIIDIYSNEIYTQRFLKKWVYRTKRYTMICVDTHTDGNKFLQIFDNKKERIWL